MSGHAIDKSFVDLGYKGHDVKDTEVIMSRQKNLTNSLKKALKRRNLRCSQKIRQVAKVIKFSYYSGNKTDDLGEKV